MVIGDLRIPFAFSTSIIPVCRTVLAFLGLERPPFGTPSYGPLRAITCGLRLTGDCAFSLI